MALVQIQALPTQRVIWVKLSQAAKMVSQGQAKYAAASPDTAMVAPPENAAVQTGRAGARKRR